MQETRGTVLLAGALDTKGVEYEFVKALIEAQGHAVLVVDFGVLDEPRLAPDVSSTEVAEAAGEDLAELRSSEDKTRASGR